ncbi:hypothetical protein [Hymenobacter psychrophilus]|uniref:LTXXQ motif family protein n=1 Tax=Hymenobacter psychrophilus TaxID=651662 RepID=A0A1H3CN65_9BACT|nr:hypothetical protein [Hymenobacter psychrophilus]SDX55593.1 hypothetical protein SAMN04488069_10254 [Hymenobacter psychrophilus]
MKALFLTLLFLGSLGSVAQAQMKEQYAERAEGADPTVAEAEALTKQMTAQLRLNEAQIVHLRKINSIKVAQADEIQWQYHENPSRMQQALSELQSHYDKECSRILTPSQLSLMRGQQPATPAPLSDTEGGLG